MAKRKKELSEREQRLLKAVGDKLKELRKGEGFNNYEDFAFEKGINRFQYGKYEVGNIDIQLTTLLNVIDKLENTSFREFFANLDFE